MRFQQLDYHDVIDRVSYRGNEFLEPVMSTLRFWDERTEVIRERWKNAHLGISADGNLLIEGYPVHPYAQKRLMSVMLGVKDSHKEVWEQNPDLLSEALRRAPQLLDADEVQVRIVNGQVVYVTDLPQDLGTHGDFLRPMAEHLEKTSNRTSTAMGLVGFLVDPAWVHLRIAYLPRGSSTIQTGVQLDSNYLFSRSVRGRASYGLFGYDTVRETTLTMDNWWSLRTPNLHPDTSDELVREFTRRLDRSAQLLRERTKVVAKGLRQRNRLTPRQAWKQDVLSNVGRRFAGRDAVRQAVVGFEKNGKGPTDYIFAMAGAMRDMPFDRRVSAERYLAHVLKEAS